MNRDKLFFRIALGISIVVFLLVVILNRRLLPAPEIVPSFVRYLPGLNAIINGTCSILLLISLWAIRNKKVSVHKTINLTTFGLSALFLISYVLFHYFIAETTFGGEGSIGTVYYTILVSHIILAAVVLPLILLSFYHALNGNLTKHKRIVRFSYPIWLYVTITGVIVYLLISPYYTFN